MDLRRSQRVLAMVDQAPPPAGLLDRFGRDKARMRPGFEGVNVLGEDRDPHGTGDAPEVGGGRCDRDRDPGVSPRFLQDAGDPLGSGA
jgi:hypothetical protein